MVKYLSLFSGIGAFERALNNLKIDFELVGYSEIDKYASKSYSIMHNVSESKNLGDITKIDESKLPNDIDLITYGFPCQDISIQGNQKGFFENGKQTRSGLFFDAFRIIKATKPKIAIAENVKALTSKRFEKELNIVLKCLNDAGYNNYYQVLKANDYGIPQSRERVFIVSIRKDIDTGIFEFPKPIKCKPLENFIENRVSRQWYFTEKKLNTMNNRKYIDDTHNKHMEYLFSDKSNDIEIMDYRYDKGIRIRFSRLCPTLMTKDDSSLSGGPIIFCNGKFRHLSHKERFKIMGFTFDDYEKIKDVNTKNSLIAQTGNSIVVDVAEELLCMLFDSEGKIFT